MGRNAQNLFLFDQFFIKTVRSCCVTEFAQLVMKYVSVIYFILERPDLTTSLLNLVLV